MVGHKEDGRATRARAIHSDVHDKVIGAMRRLILDGDLPTSSELAKEAGVSTTTIYNHFPDSIQGILRELIARIDGTAAEAALALRFTPAGPLPPLPTSLVRALRERSLLQPYLLSWATQIPFVDPEIGFRYQ